VPYPVKVPVKVPVAQPYPVHVPHPNPLHREKHVPKPLHTPRDNHNPRPRVFNEKKTIIYISALTNHFFFVLLRFLREEIKVEVKN
jgi:hypothetical protein